MKYKTIIFDLYHTLVDIHTEEHEDSTWLAFASYLKKFSIDYTYEELREKYFEYDTALRNETSKYIYPEIEIIDVFHHLCEDKGRCMSQEELHQMAYAFRCYSRESIRVYDGVIPLFQKLLKENCKIILLSNAQHYFTMPEIQMLKLDQYFHAIYLSSDYGCMKPDPNFFELVFQNHNTSNSDCIMIGDSIQADISGADVVGIDSLLLDNNRNLSIPNNSRCIGVVERFDREDLLQWLT